MIEGEKNFGDQLIDIDVRHSVVTRLYRTIPTDPRGILSGCGS